jgi:uncharacterized cupin superfamily protein
MLTDFLKRCLLVKDVAEAKTCNNCVHYFFDQQYCACKYLEIITLHAEHQLIYPRIEDCYKEKSHD